MQEAPAVPPPEEETDVFASLDTPEVPINPANAFEEEALQLADVVEMNFNEVAALNPVGPPAGLELTPEEHEEPHVEEVLELPPEPFPEDEFSGLAAMVLLEQGGENTSAALFAKKLGVDAVGNDVEISHQMEKLVLLYEEAADTLRRAKTLPEVNGITGYEDFEAMADAYEQRANHYKQAIDLLKKVQEAPPMTATEEDALKMALAIQAWQATAGACVLRVKNDE